jgi:hypothetical protein
MSTVAEIKAAIDQLSLQQRCELEALLHPDWDDDWDRQMKRDAAAGKLGKVLSKVDADIAKGNLRDLP